MIELADPEGQILSEIADPAFKRADIITTYALILKGGQAGIVNWPKVNRAIVTRWSLSSLDFIKRAAWRKAST